MKSERDIFMNRLKEEKKGNKGRKERDRQMIETRKKGRGKRKNTEQKRK